MILKKRLFNFFALLIITFSNISCVSHINIHGNRINEKDLSQIIVGVSEKDNVAEIIGTPSFVSINNNSSWYYLYYKTYKRAFFDPKLQEQKLINVEFDSNGLVSSILTYTEEDMNEIRISDKSSYITKNSNNFFMEILGNFGKFDYTKDSF